MTSAASDRTVRVFVSSTGILRHERLLVVKVCRNIGLSLDIHIEPLLWEGGGKDEPNVLSFPARISGEGAQYEIDEVLSDIGGCDIYVGMIWYRMGTPTGEYKSGTEAEFRGALRERGKSERPAILFYRKNADIPADVKPRQLAGAQKFAKEIEKLGLMQRFEDVRDLESQLYAHLPKAIKRARPDLFSEDQPAAQRSKTLLQAAEFAHPYPLQPDFTGRIRERTLLTDWLATGDQPLFALVARGGMGKSALAWAWLLRDVLGLPLPGAATDSPEDAEACRLPLDSRLEGAFWWSFYDEDSTFEGFLDRALAYAAGGEAPEGVEGGYEKMEALVNLLRERRLLLVLDGFERLLRQYASMEAVYQKDEEDDVPAEDRACTDPNAATFLRQLAGAPVQSRVLFTSRLFPSELEGRQGGVVANCHREVLQMLGRQDTTAFFHAQDVKGSRSEIEAASHISGSRPLALRLLAGLTSKDKEMPGDVQATEKHASLQAPRGARLDAMLKLSYDDLGRAEQSLLSKIAAFRSPVDYEAVSIFKTQKKEKQFDDALDELIDRGLLFFDREHVRYDLHPLVREYAYERLEDKVSVHERLAEYFATLPVPEDEEVRSVEDLAPLIELYHHTVGAGRYDDAYRLYAVRLDRALYFTLGAYQTSIELLLALFPEGEHQPSLQMDEGGLVSALNDLACAYSLSGQSRRALPLTERLMVIEKGLGRKEVLPIEHQNLADDEIKLGALADAESDLRKSIDIAKEAGDAFDVAGGHRELGWGLAYKGQRENAEREFAQSEAYYQRTRSKEALSIIESYRAQNALLAGDPESALKAARLARFLAEESAREDIPVERNFVRAEWLIGATLVAMAQGSRQRDINLNEGETHLTEALKRCRKINLVELEPDILLSWARWYQAKGNRDAALEQADEALSIADRCEYRLNQADIHNFLAALEMEEGNHDAAVEHAMTGYERAWCDGPPHAYQPALDEAKRLLDELGVEPPEMPAYAGD